MISLPLKPKIIKKEKNKTIFEIEALYPGYGVTVGNSLRRVLLSSLEGAAVTQMKIKNISHELSTIPGVLEDVITIMLNLKQLRFRIFTEEPQKATLKVKGEKKVKGSDFELPSQLELINKRCHIATLTDKKAELEIEIQVERGIGYLPREARGKEKLEIGTIPLDAIFTPVKRVAFKVENMRVGKRTDFDRLFLEVETDGTISSQEAFSQASEILVNHFDLLYQSLRKEPSIAKATEGKEKVRKKKKKEKKKPIKKTEKKKEVKKHAKT
ncbi:MAG: DNA-directed RNA polymerase subunit alpha [Candidatus Paceibacterales bacterium]